MTSAAKTETFDPDTGEVTNVPMIIADTGVVTAITRAELDVQITTARAYPRSLKSAMKNITALATIDEATASECLYVLPRGGKPIRGGSIRLAEITANQYKNIRVESRVESVNRHDKVLTAEATAHDLENNSAVRTTVQRRISDKRGRLYNDDMIITTANAAMAIARRNAIFSIVPRAMYRPAIEACERIVAGDIKTLSARRDSAVKAFANFGVKPEQIFAALDVGGIEDIALEHMPTLQGMFSALKNGEETVESMFDPRRLAAGASFDVIPNPLKDDTPKADPATEAQGEATDDGKRE